jgi:signal transduction histidine kinase
LKEQLRLLDSAVVLARNPGDSGVYVGTLDAVAWHLVSHAPAYRLDVSRAATGLLGRLRTNVVPATDERMWDAALRQGSDNLPAAARSGAFFEAEYGNIVVPGRITTRDEYLRARRQGRGVALGRAQRGAVWDVIEAFRAATADVGTTNYDEKAMIAATALDTAFGNGAPRVADHVLVDEAQDLNPARLVLLRALVATGNDDLFLAEDSQQRIYAPRTVLVRHGIHVAGRSRRLQLNYRTTAQNVGYATAVLGGQEIVDLEDGVVDASGLRSARSGPPPTATGYDTPEAAYNAAAATVHSWLANGAAPHTVAVLVRTGNDATALVRRLVEHEIPTQHVGAKDTPGEDRVVVMTMHRSKGMEFRNVLVFGTTAESTKVPDRLSDGDPTGALLRERSLLYVATTRAREHVALIWHGAPSVLLPAPRTTRAVVDLVRPSAREEREAIAREVHDGVGHSLAQIALQVSALEAAPNLVAVRETSARIRATARRAHSELQDVLGALRTGAEGLAEASFDDLSHLLGDLKNQGARITSTVVVTEGHTADGALALACYRIVQESVTNALRHAEGLPVDITLRGDPATGVTIVVHNPLPGGVSIVPAPTRSHSGIAGMTDRAVKLGGTLSATAVDGRFVVDARIPWKLA